MKKIIPFIVTAFILISCGSYKKTSTQKKHQGHKKTIKRTVASDKKRAKTKKEKISKQKKEIINVANNKTVYNEQIFNTLYKDRTDLYKPKIDYIKKYGAMAIHEMENYKIPASITLAQGLLESRFGTSILTTKANNHFGIKCHKWEGGKVYHDDDEKGECFRKYEHAESSYRDHSLFLYQKKRYADLFRLAPNDYKGWAEGLKKAGYATDKKYPDKLISLIEEYELYFFDNLVLGENYSNKDLIKDIEEDSKTSNNNKTYIVDNSKIYIVGTGETLYSISKANNITIEQLKKYNNLTSNDISVGQELIMYPANNKESTKKENYINYEVKKGDTIYSIAKKYRTTVSDILKINELETSEISIGQNLKLKKTAN